jgi:hypothetical protein
LIFGLILPLVYFKFSNYSFISEDYFWMGIQPPSTNDLESFSSTYGEDWLKTLEGFVFPSYSVNILKTELSSNFENLWNNLSRIQPQRFLIEGHLTISSRHSFECSMLMISALDKVLLHHFKIFPKSFIYLVLKG